MTTNGDIKYSFVKFETIVLLARFYGYPLIQFNSVYIIGPDLTRLTYLRAPKQNKTEVIFAAESCYTTCTDNTPTSFKGNLDYVTIGGIGMYPSILLH